MDTFETVFEVFDAAAYSMESTVEYVLEYDLHDTVLEPDQVQMVVEGLYLPANNPERPAAPTMADLMAEKAGTAPDVFMGDFARFVRENRETLDEDVVDMVDEYLP